MVSSGLSLYQQHATKPRAKCHGIYLNTVSKSLINELLINETYYSSGKRPNSSVNNIRAHS